MGGTVKSPSLDSAELFRESGKIAQAIEFLSHYIHGKEKALKLALMCVFSRGHLLVEDLPGLGKTTLAIAIAKILGLSFSRIQCTSDLLPSDITGLSIFNRDKNVFELHPGPIFNHIVLVDEINRATPKTQSALLEAMGEKQVTLEGKTLQLPRPFFVIATQNPGEHFGTFPLPESQMDRFMMRISIGYPPRSAEREILTGGSRRRELYGIDPFLHQADVLRIQDIIKDGIHASEKILDYLQDVVHATRTSRYLAAGLSTRGALALLSTARACAYMDGRDFVIPENIKEVAEYVVPHRVLFREEFNGTDKKEVIESILSGVDVPV